MLVPLVYLQQRIVKKAKKMMKIINTDEKNLILFERLEEVQ